MDTVTIAADRHTGPVFHRETVHHTLVLKPHRNLGSLQESDIFAETRELVEIVTQAGAINILIDLGGQDYLGTAMLGAIVRLWKRVSLSGGRMALCHVSDGILQVLRITKLHAIWPIYPTREEALRAFGE